MKYFLLPFLLLATLSACRDSSAPVQTKSEPKEVAGIYTLIDTTELLSTADAYLLQAPSPSPLR